MDPRKLSTAQRKLRSNTNMASSSAFPSLLDLAPMQDVLQILKCPVCQDLMSPPIYMCTTGHSICNVCNPELTECPICKGKLSGARNFAVEQIISSSVPECSYKANGCQATAKGEFIGEHIISCEFRPRPCPLHLFDDYKEDLQHTSVLHHLKSKHKLNEKLSFTGETAIRFSLDEYHQSDLKINPNSCLACHGNKFFVCMLSSQQHLHWTILLIANEAGEEKYCGEITLKLEEEQEVRWIFPIVSIFDRTVMENVLEGFGCTGAYLKQNIYRLCSTYPELNVVFKIRSKNVPQSNQQQPQQNSLSGTIPIPQRISWVPCCNGSVPDRALVGGVVDGLNIYVIRAEHNGAVIPGLLVVTNGFAFMPFFDGVHRKAKYEVLVVANPAESVNWI